VATLRRQLAPAAGALLDAVLAAAEQRRVAVWLVGGPVRDLLLRRPVHDVDLVLELPEAGGVEALARAAAPKEARVTGHARFGTVRLATPEAALDLAAARRERYARPGALPTVEPAPIDEDLQRRDFTVNALALALTAAARSGRPALLDPGGAVADLEARVLRVLHARSFHDDPTRALRAARLGVRLGFRLSRGSRSSLRDALRDGAFGAVSGDRFRREIEKLFGEAPLGQDPAAALRLLGEWHVLGGLEPGLIVPRSAAPALRRLGRAAEEIPEAIGSARPWVAGLAAWLADLDATLRQRTLRRLSLRGEAAERIAEFPKRRARWQRALERARGRGAVDAVLGPLDEESLLALWSGEDPATRRRIARWFREDRARRAPVTGADLVAAGLAGPTVGTALSRIRAAFLDGAVRERDDALALAREVAAREAARARRRAKPGGTRARARERSTGRPPARPAAKEPPDEPARHLLRRDRSAMMRRGPPACFLPEPPLWHPRCLPRPPRSRSSNRSSRAAPLVRSGSRSSTGRSTCFSI
jgi:tRNA nucleotidyltransferase (CCA-adding enzyme)